MTTNQEIMNKLNSIQSEIEQLNRKAKELVAGRKARIISGYNGQPYGHSKPSMKGKTIRINGVVVEDFYIWFFGEGLPVCLSPSDLEFID